MNINQRLQSVEQRLAGPRGRHDKSASAQVTTDMAACATQFNEFAAQHPIDETAFHDFSTALESMKASNQ